MPNHFHFAFWIVNASGDPAKPAMPRQFGQPQKGAVGTIVGALKAAVTRQINNFRQAKGVSIWQRSYYDQIIRNERHLTAVRQYILNNPANWESDKLHPNAPPNKFNQFWPPPRRGMAPPCPSAGHT